MLVSGSKQRVERSGDKDGGMSVAILTPREVRTLDDLIEVCEIDQAVWSIESWTCKAWMMGAKDAASVLQTAQLFSVTAKLRPRSLAIDFRAQAEAILSEVRSLAPRIDAVASVPSSPKLLELSIPDVHLGKLAWWRECGQSYDVKIASDIYMRAVDDLLRKVSPYEFDQIVLVVGNDFLNADNFENTTTRGTPQSTDGRQQRTFWIARKLITDVVMSRLLGLAPEVRIVMVAGNHDLNTNFYLGEVLDAYFTNCPSVHVDNSPTVRKYLSYGENLIMWTHGSEEKHADLPLIMATERPEDWGRTRFREVHLGHMHKRRAQSWLGVDEHKGVTVRILPSLCASEDWHTSQGYVGNIRSAEAYVWDPVEGLCGTAIYNVPPYTDSLPNAA